MRKSEEDAMMSDLSLAMLHSSTANVTALNARGMAFLKFWCDPDDPPTLGDDGMGFVVIAAGDLGQFLEGVKLAGLKITPALEGTVQ
jgi:tripartite-type tricarboxylate transporter receptor subunit TctC